MTRQPGGERRELGKGGTSSKQSVVVASQLSPVNEARGVQGRIHARVRGGADPLAIGPGGAINLARLSW